MDAEQRNWRENNENKTVLISRAHCVYGRANVLPVLPMYLFICWQYHETNGCGQGKTRCFVVICNYYLWRYCKRERGGIKLM